MSTNFCSSKKRSSTSAIVVCFVLVVIPMFLGMLAAVEHWTTKVPEETTATFISHANDRYLDIVSDRYAKYRDAQFNACEAVGNEPIEKYDAEKIAEILALDPEKTVVRKNGIFETTLENGDVMTVSEKSISVGHVYLPLYSNGHITNVWEGYSQENETGLVLGGKKRTVEELSTIAMVAHHAQSVEDGYHWVDKNGTRMGGFAMVFFGYLILEISILIVAFAIWVPRR